MPLGWLRIPFKLRIALQQSLGPGRSCRGRHQNLFCNSGRCPVFDNVSATSLPRSSVCPRRHKSRSASNTFPTPVTGADDEANVTVFHRVQKPQRDTTSVIGSWQYGAGFADQHVEVDGAMYLRWPSAFCAQNRLSIPSQVGGATS